MPTILLSMQDQPATSGPEKSQVPLQLQFLERPLEAGSKCESLPEDLPE